MSASWKLQDAKDKFSEVVARAMKGEPQRVTKRGQDAVVVVSAKAFDKKGGDKGSKDFVRYLLSAPKIDFTPPRRTKWPKRKHPFE
jgi:prevent-host-death family protein